MEMITGLYMDEILVVEDNLEVALILSSILRGSCRVQTATSIAEGKDLFSKSHFDLVLLDLNLPDGSGLNLASILSQINPSPPMDTAHSLSATGIPNSITTQRVTFDTINPNRVSLPSPGRDVPFLFLSGDQSTESQLAGLSLGAIDYITKPFNPLILKAKVLNCLKRSHREGQEELYLGDLILNKKELRVYSHKNKDDRHSLDLTALEFRLFTAFYDHFNQALTRSVLIDLVWGENTHVIDRVVDQHIFGLRKKLKDSNVQIKSVYGHGYRLEIAP